MQILVLKNFLPEEWINRALAYRAPANKLIKDQDTWFTQRTKQDYNDPEFWNWFFEELRQVEVPDEFTDYAWACLRNWFFKSAEAAVSRYVPNGLGYKWHVDHLCDDLRVMNFVINLDDANGALEITDEPWPNEEACFREYHCEPKYVSDPEPGKMVLFPSHYPHRVMPSLGQRTTLHGHLRLCHA